MGSVATSATTAAKLDVAEDPKVLVIGLKFHPWDYTVIPEVEF